MLGCTFEDVDGHMGEDERVSREWGTNGCGRQDDVEYGGEAQIYTGMRQEHSIGTMNSNHEPGMPHIWGRREAASGNDYGAQDEQWHDKW